MPSFQIHLAIGNRYIQKHKIKDEKSFLEGIIAPDFTDNKDKTHYTNRFFENEEDLIERGSKKVIIEDFLKENKIKTDYDKGVLLHLLTDKIFFTEFFPKDYLKSTTYQNFCRDLYKSYEETNSYLIQKYNIVLSQELKEKMQENIRKSNEEKKVTGIIEQGNSIIPIKKLEKFIEEMSDMNLESFVKKQESQENV